MKRAVDRPQPRALAALALLALCATARPAAAAEGWDACTGYIVEVPAIIESQGTWCLAQSVQTALAIGKAIDVRANNVTLDCNGLRVRGTAGDATQAYGVFAQDRLNLTVRNCMFSGFLRGVQVAGGGGHLIEQNHFMYNREAAIAVAGSPVVVRDNRLQENGGSSVYRDVFGILASGQAEVLDNFVITLRARGNSDGNAIGIASDGNSSGSLRGNHLAYLYADGTGATVGIRASNHGRLALRDNVLRGSGAGTGLACAQGNARAKDNVVVGFATAISACSGSDN